MKRRRRIAVVAAFVAAAVVAVVAVILPRVGHSTHGTAPARLNGLSLRELAATRGVVIGVGASTHRLSDPQYQRLVGENFNSITDQNAFKWQLTEPRPGEFNFAITDRVVSVAQRYHLRVRGATLVWHNQMPGWLSRGHWTKESLKAVMKRHIMTVVSHYRGRVAQWDVVNEALSSGSSNGGIGLRRDLFERVIGPEYVADSFIWAHEADPNAQLFYNEYGAESPSPKFDAELKMVMTLRARGVPITGVGLQTHRPSPQPAPPYYPTQDQVTAVLSTLAANGFRSEITELDEPLPLPASEPMLVVQALLYGQMMRACLSVAQCTGVTVWGADDTDRYRQLRDRNAGAATLFAAPDAPKLSFFAVARALRKAPGPVAADRASPGYAA